MKFLRAVRLDDSDDQVYLAAARAGEPVVTGSFLWTFSNDDPAGFRGKRLNAFRSGFLGTESFGHCTLAAVGEVTDTEFRQIVERIAAYMVEHYGAPSTVAALPRAREEAEYAASLCDRDPGHLIALEREVVLEEISENVRSIDPGQAWRNDATPVFRIVAQDDTEDTPSR
ncbi:MAG: DUF6505 family protein [Lysobacteraceae bacterium]